MSEEEIEYQNGLSETQEKILALVPIIPSLASAYGSALIVYIVYKARHRNPYKRILFAMSACDIICSLAFPFQSFLVPHESSQIAWAIGTDATCSMLGFLTQFAFTGLLYNGMLSFYFLCSVRFAMKDDIFARRFEPLVHLIAFGYPLMTAISGVAINAFHEQDLGFGCWISDYPEGCVDCLNTDIELGDEDVCCKTVFLGWLFGGFPAIIVFFSIVINNLIIYLFVRRTIKRAERFNPVSRLSVTSTTAPATMAAAAAAAAASTTTSKDFASQTSGSTIGATTIGETSEALQAGPANNSTQQEVPLELAKDESSNTNGVFSVQTNNRMSRRHRRSLSRKKADNRNNKITMVATQAMLYVGAYLVTFAAGLTLRIMGSMKDYSTADQSPLFPIMVLHHILFPFQGALNIFVYIRPNFIRVRKDFPNCTRWWALRRSLFGASVSVRQSGASYHFGNMAKRFSLSGSLFSHASTGFIQSQLPSRSSANWNTMVDDSKNENSSTAFHLQSPSRSRSSVNFESEDIESKTEDTSASIAQYQHNASANFNTESMLDESQDKEDSSTAFVQHQNPAHSSMDFISESMLDVSQDKEDSSTAFVQHQHPAHSSMDIISENMLDESQNKDSSTAVVQHQNPDHSSMDFIIEDMLDESQNKDSSKALVQYRDTSNSSFNCDSMFDESLKSHLEFEDEHSC